MGRSNWLFLALCAAIPVVGSTRVEAQAAAGRHPCPALVDTTKDARAVTSEAHLTVVSGGREYFRRVLQVQLDTVVSPVDVCAILRNANAAALDVTRSGEEVSVLVRLNRTPAGIAELEERRAAVAELVGVRSVKLLRVPRGVWPRD